MKVTVVQLGARRHYLVPRALETAGALEWLVTDMCADVAPWRWLNRVLGDGMRPAGLRRLLDRKVSLASRSKIRTLPMFSVAGLWDGRSAEQQTDYWARRNAAFAKAAVRAGFANADTVYAFNGAALEVLRAARAQGLRTALDQTAAAWRWNRRLLTEEAQRWPGWEERPGEIDDSGRLTEREEAEWELADHIICGSEFAMQTVESSGPAARCVVVRYLDAQSGRDNSGRRVHDPLRVLFVGTLQLRKGIQYLLEAKKLLAGDNVVVRVVGPSVLTRQAMAELGQELELTGPVPRSQLAAHYDWADVFVLPTLSEGSANVVREAIIAGVPVVTTANAGAVVREGQGLIVPIRDAPALAQAIRRIAAGSWCEKGVRSSHEPSGEEGLLAYGTRLVDVLTSRPGFRIKRPSAAEANPGQPVEHAHVR